MPITEAATSAAVRARLANIAQREAEETHARRLLARLAREKRRKHESDPDVQRYREEKAANIRKRIESRLMAEAKRRYVEEVVHAADFRCGRGRRANQRFEARDPVDRLLGSLGEWRGE